MNDTCEFVSKHIILLVKVRSVCFVSPLSIPPARLVAKSVTDHLLLSFDMQFISFAVTSPRRTIRHVDFA